MRVHDHGVGAGAWVGCAGKCPTGECSSWKARSEGIAVHIGARVAVEAGGAGLEHGQGPRRRILREGAFRERGVVAIEGVSDVWRLDSVDQGAPSNAEVDTRTADTGANHTSASGPEGKEGEVLSPGVISTRDFPSGDEMAIHRFDGRDECVPNESCGRHAA